MSDTMNFLLDFKNDCELTCWSLISDADSEMIQPTQWFHQCCECSLYSRDQYPLVGELRAVAKDLWVYATGRKCTIGSIPLYLCLLHDLQHIHMSPYRTNPYYNYRPFILYCVFSGVQRCPYFTELANVTDQQSR